MKGKITGQCVIYLQLEVVKSKIRASQSKEEAESLKFSEKHLINKVCILLYNCLSSFFLLR